jgi:hypothetical protein
MKNDKVLCKCGRFYHDPKFETCWECYAIQPVNTFKKFDKMMGNPMKAIDGLVEQARELNNKNLKTKQEYTSVKEYQEITGEI